MSLRPIAAATEEAAWDRAHRILEAERARSGRGAVIEPHGSEGSLRLRQFADEGPSQR